VSAVSMSVSWLELAACRGRPTAWWFPSRGHAFAAEVAKRVCRACPVQAECLADAIAVEVDGYVYGIRAGLSADERLRMASRRGSIVFVPVGSPHS
jgi:WhiB family redox-sensing transcriptional regulator